MNVTIVTNSAFIADYIREEDNVQIVLPGGIYQKDSQCLVGPMIRDSAMNYNVHLCLIGTDGWSERTGFTNKDQMRAQAVRDMSTSAEKVVILTESEKFRSAGTVPMNLRCPQAVITDSMLEEHIRTVLTNQRIEIITAE